MFGLFKRRPTRGAAAAERQKRALADIDNRIRLAERQRKLNQLQRSADLGAFEDLRVADLARLNQVLEPFGLEIRPIGGAASGWQHELAGFLRESGLGSSLVRGLGALAAAPALPRQPSQPLAAGQPATGSGAAAGPPPEVPAGGPDLSAHLIAAFDGRTPADAAGLLLAQSDPGFQVLIQGLCDAPDGQQLAYLREQVAPAIPELAGFVEWLAAREAWLTAVVQELRARRGAAPP